MIKATAAYTYLQDQQILFPEVLGIDEYSSNSDIERIAEEICSDASEEGIWIKRVDMELCLSEIQDDFISEYYSS